MEIVLPYPQRETRGGGVRRNTSLSVEVWVSEDEVSVYVWDLIASSTSTLSTSFECTCCKCTQPTASFERDDPCGVFLSSDAQAELDSVEAELELVELQISDLLEKQAELTSRKNALLQCLGQACDAAQSSSSSKSKPEPAMSKKQMKLYDGTGNVHTWLHCGSEEARVLIILYLCRLSMV